MNEYPKSDLVHGVVFPNVTAMMTGIYQVTRKGNMVTAHYTDGSTESCIWAMDKPLTEYSAFELTSTVQKLARTNQ